MGKRGEDHLGLDRIDIDDDLADGAGSRAADESSPRYGDPSVARDGSGSNATAVVRTENLIRVC